MDNPINIRGRKTAGALGAAALALLLMILLALTLCSLTVFAQLGLDGPYEDSIRFLPESLMKNLLLTAAAIAANPANALRFFKEKILSQWMEAKSQYIYPYMMYMMPLAGLGLTMTGEGISHILSLHRAKRRREFEG